MPVTRPPLTPRQLAVLKWIDDGCPEGIWPDHSHKLSVGVLETRNLASVRRWYGKWHAVIQPDGQFYLEHGDYPDPTPATNPAVVRAAVPRSVPTPKASREKTIRQPAPTASDLRSAKAPSPTEQLVADILAAGGSLFLDPKSDKERTRLDSQISAIRRFGKVPPGTQLIVDRHTWSKRTLQIVALPEWMTAALAPVPVLTQLRTPHAAIAKLRDTERSLPVTGGAHRNRALRLLQALVLATEARGYKVAAVTERTDQYGRNERHPTQLRFTVRGHDVGLRISQENDRADHVPTARELAEKQRYQWTRIPKYDYSPSRRLKFELVGAYEHRQSSWTDGARTRLEDKLAEILQEIELRSDAAERARLAAEERRRQEQIAEEQRIARAKIKLIEANRSAVLDDQLTRWLRARHLDTYLDAMETIIEKIEDPTDGVVASEWLAWAKAHAQATDPLHATLAMPPDPEPTHAALEPYMERPRGTFNAWTG